ncbi:hypothetical protein OSB04_023326 [Centaurea solstitialis]|uniref:Protein-S-isoprenylcysteine O-methyltransferase n=1 Tax=Centaurea solstitialis TaxID=347529 RepID=A0AA38WAY8_9ASTR|nr:hypothetical protein OSB04_023326 [Centaurea solstitialis]
MTEFLSESAHKQLSQMFHAVVFFHVSEYLLALAHHGKSKVTVESLLITRDYILAMMFSMLEYLVELYIFPTLKENWSISNFGLMMVVLGESIRKLAILTAGRSFTHFVQRYHEDGHQLVTYGVYGIVRHPAYTGFLIWSLGTQVMLCNPISTVAFSIILWDFFHARIPYEEFFLRQFYGAQHEAYVRRNKVQTRTKPNCKNEGTNKITRDFVHGRPLAAHPLALSERGLHMLFPSQHKITCDFLGSFDLANWVVLAYRLGEKLRPSAAVQVIPPAQAATSAPHQLYHYLTTTLPFHPQPYSEGSQVAPHTGPIPVHLGGVTAGRRSSYRLKIRNTFSRLTNTEDDPLCPDMDSEANIQYEGEKAEEKVKKMERSAKPRSLNKIFEDNECKLPKVDRPKNKQKREGEPSSQVKGIFRKLSRKNTNTKGGQLRTMDGGTAIPERVNRSREKKVSFKDVKGGKCDQKKAKTRSGDFSKPQKVYIIGEEDDDDDYVEPIFVREGPVRSPFKHGKRQPESIPKVVPRRRQQDGKLNGIRTKTSPKTLCLLITKLTLPQAEAVEEMGLGSLLDMTVDGIPEKLGYFVVEHLNTETMELQFGVSEILGLPNVGIDLSVETTDVENKIVFKSWRKKYEGIKIRPTNLADDIKKSGLADDDFKINFMLLFASIMGECSPQGCCLMTILQKFSSIEMINSVNWAKYIFDCLCRSKSSWRPNKPDTYYTGPLTFLTLLYVTRTEPLDVTVDQNAPPLCAWTMKMLRARQDAKGGLDAAPIRVQLDQQIIPVEVASPIKADTNDSQMVLSVCSAYNEIPTENYVDMTDANVDQVNVDNMSADDEVPGQQPVAEEKEEDDDESQDPSDFEMDMDDLTKEYIRLIDNKFATLHETRWDLEELIDLAQQFFPYESVFKNYNKSRRCIFRDCETDGNDSDGEDDEDSESDDDAEMKEENEDTFVTPVKGTAENCVQNDQLSPLSPIWLTQTTYDILESSIPKAEDVKPMSIDDKGKGPDIVKHDNDVDVIPSDNKGFSPIKSCSLPKPSGQSTERAANTVKEQTPKRRAKKIGKQLRSPFIRRQVLVGVAVKPQETRVHDLCLSNFRGADDVLYKSETGTKMIRTTLETLAADEDIYTNVIDGWVDVLNMEEQYRSPDSPYRYFFTPSLLVGGVLMRYTYGFKQRYEMFRSNLVSEANGSDDIINMRSFDMVFFPILQGRHYFCVVFNLKKNTVDILDNIEKKDNVDMYDNAISDLKHLFVHHLNVIEHPAAETLERVNVRLLEMKWQTKGNFVDCGVFLMRHMETYMGGGVRGWFTGLTTEGET